MRKKKEIAQHCRTLAIVVSLAIISFKAHALDVRLLPFASVSDKEQRELYLDEMYFNAVKWPRGLSYNGLETKERAGRYFGSQISAVTTDSVSGCTKDTSKDCTSPTAYLLDDNFVVYGLTDRNSIYIGNKKLVDNNSRYVIKVSGSSALQSALGPEAISIYRLSHFFGLARLAEVSSESDSPPLTTCYTLLDKPYTCDNVSGGAMAVTGDIMYNYTQSCSSCTHADIATLDMISAHYLLRSKNSKVTEKGVEHFSRNKNIFKSVGVNYEELREIYLKSITN